MLDPNLNHLSVSSDSGIGILIDNDEVDGRNLFLWEFVIWKDYSLWKRLKLVFTCIFGFRRSNVSFGGTILNPNQVRDILFWLANRSKTQLVEVVDFTNPGPGIFWNAGDADGKSKDRWAA